VGIFVKKYAIQKANALRALKFLWSKAAANAAREKERNASTDAKHHVIQEFHAQTCHVKPKSVTIASVETDLS